MPTCTAESLLFRYLLSEYFSLETTFPVQSGPAVTRKRLMVPSSRMTGLVVHKVEWYSVVKGSLTLAAYQRPWQINPADTKARDAMVTVARYLMDLRQQERTKYWVSFLDRVHKTRSLWAGMAPRQQCEWQAQGRCVTDPAGKARPGVEGSLILPWSPCETPGNARSVITTKDRVDSPHCFSAR
ncbi:hypothetical protein E2C01_066048 [Portunus trituberculatus]|uniref:Uncharacterized protein n=1 Tax=Portunus trituberculatus TaxID=210409 RepID=A0A5B7HG58_PORTR|nr:hypothetical protein [Portunus trituberculatus]